MDEMLTFYVETLGCAVERETTPDFGLVQLRAGNALIDLVSVDSELGRMGGGAPGATDNNLDHFCLQIKPLAEQQILDYLLARGIEGAQFHERYGAQGFGNSVYIKDPDQNVVELRVHR